MSQPVYDELDIECFSVPGGAEQRLEALSIAGFYMKYPTPTHEIRLRLINELEIIKSCEMTAFYLLLWDLASHAAANGILISPGCGAIPGSLVAYSLGLTDVDPMKYNLLMERFLNQKQKTRPGCRLEFELGGSRRLTDHVTEKYGKGMLKLIEQLDITFRDLEELSIIKETLKNISNSISGKADISTINYDDRCVFDLISHDGIRDTELLSELFSKRVAAGIEVRSMEDLTAGLSLDRPGLEERCSEYIRNQKNPDRIHYECPELKSILAPTYGCIVYQEQIMQILHILGGFSLEESDLACRGMAKRITVFNETTKHDFIKGNAEKGIPGCISNGISETVAEKIFDDIWTAAVYGFSKSHAAAYATLTYRMAWLKHYYRNEYMAAVEFVKTNPGAFSSGEDET